MVKIQVSQGKAETTVNTNNVWDRIVALENGVTVPTSTALNLKADKTALDATNAQLAEKAQQSDLNTTNTNVSANATAITAKADKTYVDNKVAGAVNGSPIPVSLVANMTDHTRNYVYTGTESGYTSGHWYGWNGSAWIDGGIYQSTGIAKGSIGVQETNFLDTGVNKFNKNTITDGNSIVAGAGTLTANANFFASDYIPVSGSTVYANNNSNHVSFYDVNKVYISDINVVTNFTTPSNCAYIRIDHNKLNATTIDQIMVTMGTTLPSIYVPFGYTFKLNLEPNANSIGYEKTKFLTLGTNIFNMNTVVSGYSLAPGAGTLAANSSFVSSDFIPVSPSTQYANNNSNHVVFYDSNKKYISDLNVVTTFTTPSNCAYIRIDHNTGATTTTGQVMVSQGNSLPAVYVAFGYKFTNNLELPSTLKFAAANTNFFQRSSNLFDYTNVVNGNVLNSTTGALVANAGYATSDYIPISPSTVYANNNSNHVVFYDSNKAFISGLNVVTSFTTPANCAYIRIDHNISNTLNINQVMVMTGTFLPAQFVPYYQSIYPSPPKDSTFKGKKWISYGDSITALGTWQPYVVSQYGFNHFKRGIGSTTVAETGSIAWVDADGNYVDRPTVYGGSTDTQPANTTQIHSSFCNTERINAMIPTDTEILSIMGGMNDMNNVPIGSLPTTANPTFDESTFIGAYCSMIEKIQARIPNARIILFTSTPRARYGSTGYSSGYLDTNSLGLTLVDYADATRKVANFYALPLVDLYAKVGWNKFNYTIYVSDTIHPNSTGAKRMAEVIIGDLKKLEPLS